VIKVLRSPKCSSLYLRRRTCEFVLFRVLVGARCRGAASQASVLAGVALAGTSEGTSESKSSSVSSL